MFFGRFLKKSSICIDDNVLKVYSTSCSLCYGCAIKDFDIQSQRAAFGKLLPQNFCHVFNNPINQSNTHAALEGQYQNKSKWYFLVQCSMYMETRPD